MQPSTGTESVKKFSQEGYKVIMLARNMDLLNELQSKTKNTYAYKCDVSDMDQIKDVCAKVKNDIGDPNVFIHNAVAGVADGLSRKFLSDNQRD